MSRKDYNRRCKTEKQAKDKDRIYQSKEWATLRALKINANPLCELCESEGKAKGLKYGYVRSAVLVHHIHPIEDSSTFEEMKRWAFCWSNLQSLCKEHHGKVHSLIGSQTKEVHKVRAQAENDRWLAKVKGNVTSDVTSEVTPNP